MAAVLSAFLEDFNKELTLTVDYVRIPEPAKKALRHLVNSAKEFQTKEDGFYKGVGRYDNYWNIMQLYKQHDEFISTQVFCLFGMLITPQLYRNCFLQQRTAFAECAW